MMKRAKKSKPDRDRLLALIFGQAHVPSWALKPADDYYLERPSHVRAYFFRMLRTALREQLKNDTKQKTGPVVRSR